jgi:uncharacterized protein (TIGR03790 family)
MTTTLSQSPTASFPDRPGVDGVGLMASMGLGGDGEYLVHALNEEQAVLHLRFMMNPASLAGGEVVVFVGFDATDVEQYRLVYNADSRLLSIELASSNTLSVTLEGAQPWQCIELRIDTIVGQADLWLNGVLADQVSGGFSLLKTQSVWLGVIFKDNSLAGDMYLDEVCLGDSYFGTVVVQPFSPYADEPVRWLVVYNTADPDASGWADRYRQARGVPFANLLGLSLPLTETINATQYASLVSNVDEYLARNNLDSQVMGLLLGYRVPGYVDFTGTGPLEAVPALMHTNTVAAGDVVNANASPVGNQRLVFDDLNGVRITARIDWQDLSMADLLVDRSTALIEKGIGGENSTIFFDPFAGNNPSYQQTFDEMIDWATGLSGMRTRLPIVLSGDPGNNIEASFTAVSGDGIFWGWSSTLPDADIFATPAGRRAVCGQLYLGGASATTLRDVSLGNWTGTPISAGYACVVVSSRDNPVTSIPDTGAFFDALNWGWTLGEAWHVAQPRLRSGFYLVGDPLMTVSMPRQGFDVFGPLQSVKELDPSAPLLVLPDDAVGADLSGAIPVDGSAATYLVRRTDELGRSEGSTTSIRVTNADGEARLSVSMPVWPDTPDWLVVLEAGQVRLAIFWGGPLNSMRVSEVALLSQPEGGSEVISAEPTFDNRNDHIMVTAVIPSVKTRYRWRITSSDGVVQHTDWSAWVDPVAMPTLGLQQIGVNT